MIEKICSHCGATILVGLQYCPSCLHSVRGQDSGGRPVAAVAIAPDASGTRLERLQAKWEACAEWFSSLVTPNPALAQKPSTGPTTSMSDGYTRVVCPKCLHPHHAPLTQAATSRLICTSCFHQFPASMAAEFRKGADLNCFHCGVTTFCVNGLKVNQCPNCKIEVNRPRDPEMVKLMTMATVIVSIILVGFLHAVATQTVPNFLLWLVIGTIFTCVGFVILAALGL